MISGRIISFLERATEEAKLSVHNFQHGAVAVRNGNIVSRGVNRYKESPHVPPNRNSIHAEISTLLPLDSREGVVLCVARVDAEGNPTTSKPCKYCMRKLKEWGVKKVFYTIGPEKYGEVRIA